jgi:hypothetical protein
LMVPGIAVFLGLSFEVSGRPVHRPPQVVVG